MGSRRAKITREAMRNMITRVDRISNLPDSLLLIILSLLPFDLAVRTSVLSKRWRRVCMSLSNALFDDRYGRFSGVQFNTSVDRFVMCRPRDLYIDSFGLECGGRVDSDFVDKWVDKVLKHRVKDLTLGFSFEGVPYRLIHDVYAYGKFEALRLKRGILVIISDVLRFSRLKVLEFREVTFSTYESVKEILVNCPVLEDLVIQRCKWLSGGDHLYVCGSVLKNLVLKCNEYFLIENQHRISIDTPALETLRFGDSTWANLSIEGSWLSLGTAHISVESVASVFKLLHKFCNVKFLTLTDKKLMVLNRISDLNLPILPSLIELELRVNRWTCWTVLPKILGSSPNLQSLELSYEVNLKIDGEDSYRELWSSPRLVPTCLSSNLKTIQIGIFNETKQEFSLVQYLLLHGRALREMSLYCSIDCSEWKKFRIRKKLLKFHRGSKTCKINVD
ncbi:probable FBD-associated F-box protein At1g32375 [Daucus carota subsp. sativus]|uniref:probable FBD-associated F-box protein At1g32375 n=1 Tax=Daucus carota subsp. sativus TaxID=79200 RepID=UPI0007EF1FF7|nr:PREDICTED: probable FBD-associated F-box protein At1g32375 [Daucus carota subsp. sativus]